MKKKFIALIAVLALTLSSVPVAFAADSSSEPTQYEVHEIELTIPAGDEQGISPRMWEDGNYYPDPNMPMDTPDFTIDSDHDYFCFNTTVTGDSSGYCLVELRNNFDAILSNNIVVNSGQNTNDWISVNPGGRYFFRVTNNTASTVHVYLKYYSFHG